jgi:hypothetical protein
MAKFSVPAQLPQSKGVSKKSVVQTVPLQEGPWTGLQMRAWGATIESPPGLFGLGRPNEVVAVFENPKSWGRPKAYTISLTVLDMAPAIAITPGLIRAVINAGTGAGAEVFEVDWRNGVSIGVNAGYVRVTARQDGIYSNSVRLGATLAEGMSLARSTPPTWSAQRAVYVAGAAATRIAVPRRARTVRVADSVGPLSTITVTCLQVAGALFLPLDIFALPAEVLLRTQGLPLPASCTHVDVQAVGVNSTAIIEFGLDC